MTMTLEARTPAVTGNMCAKCHRLVRCPAPPERHRDAPRRHHEIRFTPGLKDSAEGRSKANESP
jgi:hypothetical protein